MKKLIVVLFIVFILSGCVNNNKTDYKYDNLPLMLNSCKGTTVVISISKEALTNKTYLIVVKDSTDTFHQYCGYAAESICEGDTLK